MARVGGTKSWKEEWKDLFAMHRKERRAFSVLLGLCIIAAAWVTWEQWIRPSVLAEQEAQALQVIWERMEDSSAARKQAVARKQDDIQLFHFDPNNLPVEHWVLLGLSERQAASIHSYEARGGKFRTKGDLARMRVVDPELYELWEPFIQLPARAQRTWPERSGQRGTDERPGERWKESPARTGAVELNSVDSAGLVEVRGIGPAFARSIIAYRDRLGGFLSLDQLQEVPILRNKPDAVEQIRPRLEVDPAAIVPIPINSCTVEELARHPYMNWKVAKALMAYRDQHGPFQEVDDITRCVLVTDSLKERLGPYLVAD